MSHFTVIVIGPNPEAQLAPYHEFECTGENDEYVQDIDVTEQSRKRYEESFSTRLRAPDGSLHSYFDEKGDWNPKFSQLKKDPGRWEGDRREKFIPEGFEEIEVSTKDIKSFAEFLEGPSEGRIVKFGETPDISGDHKFGYVLTDELGEVIKVVDRTNPHAKWDWYKLGGRWRGYFKLREGAKGVTGGSGVFGNPPKEGWADQLYKRDIDFTGMEDAAETEARERHQKFRALVAGLPQPLSWVQTLKKNGDDVLKSREEYHAQPAIEALRTNDEFRWEDRPERFYVSEDEFARQARESAITSFAVIKDGKWYERGEMGWWGIVHDEKETDVWVKQVGLLLKEVSDDTLISVYDCHI
jgi:hypothetical protein